MIGSKSDYKLQLYRERAKIDMSGLYVEIMIQNRAFTWLTPRLTHLRIPCYARIKKNKLHTYARMHSPTCTLSIMI